MSHFSAQLAAHLGCFGCILHMYLRVRLGLVGVPTHSWMSLFLALSLRISPSHSSQPGLFSSSQEGSRVSVTVLAPHTALTWDSSSFLGHSYRQYKSKKAHP